MSKRRNDGPSAVRNFRKVGAGLALVAVSGAGAVYLYQSAGDTTSVVAIRDDVPEGSTIERSDLTSKEVSGVDGAIAVEDVSAVEGKIAAVDLLAGQVVTGEAVTSEPVPGDGERTVGLALTEPQVPDGLAPGDLVTVVAVPDSASGASKALDDPKVLVDSARVYLLGDTSAAQSGTTQGVTLVVSDDAAARVAAYAATGRAALIEAPAEGG